MPARLKPWLANIGLAACSILLTLAVLELVVFRYILVPDDVVENVSINGVVRYKPGTKATFRHPDGRNTQVTINADGWNSTKPSYQREKTPGRLRIAVLGDSYVHGAVVDVSDAFSDKLESDLKNAGVDAEVYRFGMDGAPLSQYLHMLRREVLQFQPDVVVVPLIHNDFDESYRFIKTRYASSFMKLQRDGAGNVTEIAPADFRQGLVEDMRAFNTFRYVYYKTGLYLKAKSWVSKVVWGGNEEWSPEFISSAVDIRKIKDHDANRFFAHYVLAEMKRLSEQHGFKLAVAMDGVREAIYDGKPVSAYEVGRLNEIAAGVTRELNLPFLDLQQTFAEHWAANRRRFEYTYDWHWNVEANAIVAGAVTRLLLDDRRIGLTPRARAAAPAPVKG